MCCGDGMTACDAEPDAVDVDFPPSDAGAASLESGDSSPRSPVLDLQFEICNLQFEICKFAIDLQFEI